MAKEAMDAALKDARISYKEIQQAAVSLDLFDDGFLLSVGVGCARDREYNA